MDSEIKNEFENKEVAEINKNIVYRDEFDKFTLEFEDLTARVKYLEQKLGVESGK